MKKLWPVLAVLFLTLGFQWLVATVAIAGDQCDVVGNSYTITIDGGDWILTDFVDVVGFSPLPPCGGNVSLVSPDGYYTSHKWNANYDGTLTVAGLPAKLTPEGLKLYGVPMDLYILHIGNKLYMTEQEVPQFLLK